MLDKFLRRKPCRMLTLLKDEKGGKTGRYISELAKESGATYVHTTKLVRQLEKHGLATIEKNGKQKIVKLTEEGIKIATALSDVISRFDQISAQPSPQPQTQKT